MKFVLSAAFVTLAFASLLTIGGCKKTTTNVTQDSVYHSAWMTITMTATNSGDTAYYQDITVKTLTASVLRSGVVLGYVGSPYNGDTAVYSPSDIGLYQAFDVNLIELQSYGYLNDYSTSQTGLIYRYVVIPGNVLTTSLKDYSVTQLKHMSYTEIQKVLNTSGATSGTSNKLQ